jgi:hypothetical protein
VIEPGLPSLKPGDYPPGLWHGCDCQESDDFVRQYTLRPGKQALNQTQLNKNYKFDDLVKGSNNACFILDYSHSLIL